MDAPFGPPGSQPWETAPPWDGSDPWVASSPPPPAADRAAGQPAVRRRPVTMGLAGLLAGLGVSFLLIHFARIALGTKAPIVVVIIGLVVGVALAYTLPPRQPRRPK